MLHPVPRVRVFGVVSSRVRASWPGRAGQVLVCVWFFLPVQAVLAGSGGPAFCVCVVLLAGPGGPGWVGRAGLPCVCGSSHPSRRSWPDRTGQPPLCVWFFSPVRTVRAWSGGPAIGRVLVRVHVPSAVWFSFGPLRAVCTLLVVFFVSSHPPLSPCFRCFWPEVPMAWALCG